MTEKTKANVCLVESVGLLQENAYREGEIISRTLRLSNKSSQYVYVRSERELETAVHEFGDTDFRYLHISCHGNQTAFFTALDRIPWRRMVDILTPNLHEYRRLFLSCCLAAHSEFATELLDKSDCLSILAPVGKIYFDDAAIFWASFYHLMFKRDRGGMSAKAIRDTASECANLFSVNFRYFARDNGKPREWLIG